jgi:hypothetical protein
MAERKITRSLIIKNWCFTVLLINLIFFLCSSALLFLYIKILPSCIGECDQGGSVQATYSIRFKERKQKLSTQTLYQSQDRLIQQQYIKIGSVRNSSLIEEINKQTTNVFTCSCVCVLYYFF